MSRLRVVLVSMYLGFEGVPHAGGRYLLELQRFLATESELTMLAVRSRLNEESAAAPGVPDRLLLLGHETGRGLINGGLNRLAIQADARWRRWDPGAPSLPFLLGLARSRHAREAIRAADIIDLQWSQSIRLVRLMRRLNPDARVTGTFHDVMSQSFARRAEHRPRERRHWEAVARRSRKHEAGMVARLDEVLVFSHKDAELLGLTSSAVVVAPPLASGSEPPHLPHTNKIVLVVSYLAREENDTAAHWVLDEVWPGVRAAHPDARLRFVGGGVRPGLASRVDAEGESSGVELAGFVSDLSAEYAAATACLVPVLLGAGVKFKTIEALVQGVPVATTTVGAEGIGDPDLFVRVTDVAPDLAAALTEVLSDPAAAQARADRGQEWSARTYGASTFGETIRSTWGDAENLAT
ncbi:glycosyltransferase [Nocardioides sp.]|uniref:glycosyltransferase n=1 Tax=Nocardioides sp. TaxID=35761 RepID=UPI002BC635EF|nr:glycosyltransferase [Nocardioides sp.]HXH77205.1 glycosyltransferase [Nocardioides sp.]